MNPFFFILGIIVVVEIYYWFYWLPRNWRNNKECQDIKAYVDAVWLEGRGIK